VSIQVLVPGTSIGNNKVHKLPRSMGAPSDGVGRSTKGGNGGGNDYNNYNKKKLDTNDDTHTNASTTYTTTTTCDVYLSLIQQYIGVFQIDNALFLSERCIADYPNCYEAIYLKALCYYRMNKIKNALACLNSKQIDLQQSDNHFTKTTSNTIGTATTMNSGNTNTNSSYSIGSSMLYLSAQCSYELGEYSNAETTLLRNTRILYQQVQSSQQQLQQQYTSMGDWIVQSTV
jgi:tetratricopeptide (TPR) repeat protein